MHWERMDTEEHLTIRYILPIRSDAIPCRCVSTLRRIGGIKKRFKKGREKTAAQGFFRRFLKYLKEKRRITVSL